MSKITVKGARKVKKLEVSGGDYLKNAPEKLPARRRTSSQNIIEISDLDRIQTARLVGGDLVKFRDNDFKTALVALERALTGSSLDKETLKELRDLLGEIRNVKPTTDQADVRTVWDRIVAIAHLAGLASGVIEPLLQHAWSAISAYLGIH